MRLVMVILSFLLSWFAGDGNGTLAGSQSSYGKAAVETAPQEGTGKESDYDSPALLPSQGSRFSGEDTSVAPAFRLTNPGRRTQVSQKSPFRFIKAGKVIDRRDFYVFRSGLNQFQTGPRSTSRYIHSICHLLI